MTDGDGVYLENTVNLRAYTLLASERIVEGMSREDVCTHFSRRILTLARRAADQAGEDSPFDVEDLVGYGVLGLLEAFDRFEPSQGVDFSTYASYRILGQMLDVQRSASGTTRRERQISRDLAKAITDTHKALGRDATHEELAAHLGVDFDTYWRMRGLSLPPSLEPMPADASDSSLGVAEADAPRRLIANDARKALRSAIGSLPLKDKQVVLLYYARDCSLAEVGAIIDVSPSRVCQILSAARAKMRKAIGADFDLEGDLDLSALEAVA